MSLLRTGMSLVVVTAAAMGGLFLAEKRGLVPQGTVNGVVSKVVQVGTSPQVLNQSGQVTNLLSSQASQAIQSGEVLGTSVAVERRDPPLAQKAFEYARYSYCQAAIKDYESRFGTNAPAPSDN